jgi:hypothetical protein
MTTNELMSIAGALELAKTSGDRRAMAKAAEKFADAVKRVAAFRKAENIPFCF